MPWQPIPKSRLDWRVPPNLVNYEKTAQTFAWEEVQAALAGLPGGQGLNIAYEAVDRHANGPHRDQVALRWLGRDGAIREFTYADLRTHSNRFANVLRQLGVGKGDRVFVLAGRIPELYIAALGALKNISVFCPLFSAFGPEPVFQRLSRGDAKVLVTTARLYEQKVAGLRSRLPQLEAVLLVDAIEDDPGEQLLSLPNRMAQASPEFTIPPTDPEEMAVLHFT
ncbi:MAG: AMP-binding protein, partial [Caldilineaceae bacterium]|nr:AMP-binding protein [Caldilineaceae bacterium]